MKTNNSFLKSFTGLEKDNFDTMWNSIDDPLKTVKNLCFMSHQDVYNRRKCQL